MKYFSLSLLFCFLSLYSLTAFSQVKIGDNATNVNVNALLELESTTKGLLLPRLTNTQIGAMTNVPAGMLIFSSTDSALYLRRDTGWAILALASSPGAVTNRWASNGNDIYSNNTGKVGIGTSAPVSQLSNTSANTLGSDGISGDPGSFTWAVSSRGYVGEFFNAGNVFGVGNGLAVKVGTMYADVTALDVSKGSPQAVGTPLLIVKSSGKVGIGTASPTEALDVNGTVKATGFSGSGSSLTGLSVSQVNGAAPTDNPSFTGSVGIGTTTPKAKLDVVGDIRYSGTAYLGVQYLTSEFSIPGNYYGSFVAACPIGTRLLGGGGGHRDVNEAALSIKLFYSGPDINDNNAWKIIVENSASSSRALKVYAICANVK